MTVAYSKFQPEKSYLSYKEYRNLLKGDLHGAFCFFGKEDFIKKFCIEETKKSISSDPSVLTMNFNLLLTNTKSYSDTDLSDALTTSPVICEKHLVILQGLEFLSEKDSATDFALKSVCSMAKELNDDTIFILSFAPDTLECGNFEKGKPSALYSALADSFTMVNFPTMSLSELKTWISKHFIKEGIAANPSLCEAMINRCGHDMLSLDGEIIKLCEYLKAQCRDCLTIEDVNLVTSQNSEFSAFDFSNAILGGNKNRAFEILAKYKADKEPPENISGTVASIFSKMLIIRNFEECGIMRGEISSLTGIHEYQVGLYLDAMKNKSKKEIENICKICSRTDSLIKLGAGNKMLYIERMIAQL